MRKIFVFLSLYILLLSCQDQEVKKLPYLGLHKYKDRIVDGKTTKDTLFHRISPFVFLDQDSTRITQENTTGKIYVADFFFTTCPDICPVMTSNMLLVYNRFKDSADFTILSHSIDPINDTIPALKQYALKLGLTEKQDKWHFLYGQQEEIFLLAKNSYFTDAGNDKKAPKGIVHGGSFALIDRQGRVRGVYDGTSLEHTKKLIKDLELHYNEL